MKTRKQVEEYVRQFSNVYNGQPWHGDSIERIVKQVTDEAAFWRPAKSAHSIAQVIWHMIYWRQSLIKRLAGDLAYKGSMKSEENWSTPEKLEAIGWANLKESLADSQNKLISLLNDQSDDLLEKAYSEKATYRELVEGILHHDLYHSGQIAYLKSLYANK